MTLPKSTLSPSGKFSLIYCFAIFIILLSAHQMPGSFFYFATLFIHYFIHATAKFYSKKIVVHLFWLFLLQQEFFDFIRKNLSWDQFFMFRFIIELTCKCFYDLQCQEHCFSIVFHSISVSSLFRDLKLKYWLIFCLYCQNQHISIFYFDIYLLIAQVIWPSGGPCHLSRWVHLC